MPLKPTEEELLQKVKALEDEKCTWLKESTVEARNFGSVEMASLKKYIDPLEEAGSLKSIINVEKLQSIMDDFHCLTGMVTAILDMDGTVIEATGWQDICTRFHRIHPRTAQNCTESDLFLAANLKPGEYIEYQCKNGLWDVVTPLYIGNKHLGNIYTGQFFYDDNLVDEQRFVQQAEAYGFDKDAYLDAFRRIPRYSKEFINHLMSFLVKFTSYISDVSYANMKLEMEIQERNRAEGALKESEGRLRSLINALPDLVWLKDIDGVYLACNARFESFFGTKEKDIVGKKDYDFMSKESADFFRSYDKAALEKGGPNINEEEITFAEDGHREILETIKTPMCSNEGRVLGVLGIGRDITGRKLMQASLQESEERLQLVMEGSQLGYWDWDIEDGVVRRNSHWAEMLGYTLQEVESTDNQWTDLLHPDDAATAWKSVQDHLDGKKPAHRIEYRMRTKDGNYKWILDQARVVKRDAHGKPIRMCGTHTDITERKLSEKEHERLQSQLSQAQKIESIGRLAGGVAHDFNNMLGLILGHAELAMEQLDSSHTLFADLAEIRKAAERSADLTRQLLAFARRQTISPKVLDLNETVEAILKMLRRLIGEDIDLAWLPAKSLWPVKIDPSQVDQILANLCVNARDAISGVGKVTIETGTTVFDHDYCAKHLGTMPGKFVMLAVSDSGCGMDEETLGKIFEPFFTTKGMGEGTGLGLPTVYGIVCQNNGFIDVYSEPGEGTTFKIYLPRAEEQKTEKPPSLVKRDLRGNETVLLVEDEEPLLALGRTILQRHGYEVLGTNSPTEALGMVRSYPGPIHLLITDVIMPEMNGRDLKERITEIKPGFKCIFMSGYSANVIAHHGILDEDINFLQKPFSVQALLEKVREVLDR